MAYNSNNREELLGLISHFLITIDSRVKLEPNEFWNETFKRASNIFHKVVEKGDSIPIDRLISYRDILYLTNYIHNPRNNEKLRYNALNELNTNLDQIEKELSVEEIHSQVIVASHMAEGNNPPGETEKDSGKVLSLEQYAKLTYKKIDAIRNRFSYAPLQVIFSLRDVDKTEYCREATSKEEFVARKTIVSEYLHKIALLYTKTNDLFERVMEYLQEHHSKDVEKEDLQVANSLIDKFIFVVKNIDTCYYTTTGKSSMLKAYNEALQSVIALEEELSILFDKEIEIKFG